eukprot:Skav207073  [mRNA]  locus=scaffold1909:267888:287419:+ [translate_table: standard]
MAWTGSLPLGYNWSGPWVPTVTLRSVFSDILTPLPAMGIEFDVIRGRGPVVMGDLARTLKDAGAAWEATGRLDLLYSSGTVEHGGAFVPCRAVESSKAFEESHDFLRETLKAGSTKEAAIFKKWMYGKPEAVNTNDPPDTVGFTSHGARCSLGVQLSSHLRATRSPEEMHCQVVDEFLKRMTETISNYAIYQVESGAQCIQIFESWAHCLTPELWKRFAAPCAIKVAEKLRKAYPDVPIIYFANGGSPYFSEQVETLSGYIDVIGVDAHMRMEQAAEIIERLGAGARSGCGFRRQ